MLDSPFAYSQTDVKNDPQQQIMQSIQNGDLEEAERQIDSHLKENPHAHKIHRLRNILSNAYFRSSNRKKGERQIELMLQYQFDDPVNSRPLLKQLPQLLINLSYIQQNLEPKASEVLDKSIDLLSTASAENSNNVAYSNGLSSAIGLKARLLVRHTRADEAVGLYKQELERLRGRWEKSQENPDAWIRLAYFLKAAEEALGFGEIAIVESWNLERRNLLAVAVDKFPQAGRIVKEYFSDQLKTIEQYEQAYPLQAAEMYATATTSIRAIIEKQLVKKALFPLRIDIEQRAVKLNRKIRRSNLIGESIPTLTPIEWLTANPNQKAIEAPDLNSGDVILLFISHESKKGFEDLIELNRVLIKNSPNTKLVVVAHELGQSFSRLPFVTYRVEITDEQKQKFRDYLNDEVIKTNKYEFPFGIGKDNIELAERFGIVQTPQAYELKNGKCIASFSIVELINSLSNNLTGESDEESK